MKSINELFLNSKDVARLLSIPIRTLQYLSKTGKVKAIKIGKQWRYKKSDIENYITFGTDFSREPARQPISSTERRIYPRINCSLPCYAKVIIPQKKEISTIARILNINEGGIFIENFYKEEEFSKIIADDPIGLTFELNEGCKINLDGRVLRIQDKGIAVKFKKIDSDAKELIRGYVG